MGTTTRLERQVDRADRPLDAGEGVPVPNSRTLALAAAVCSLALIAWVVLLGPVAT